MYLWHVSVERSLVVFKAIEHVKRGEEKKIYKEKKEFDRRKQKGRSGKVKDKISCSNEDLQSISKINK